MKQTKNFNISVPELGDKPDITQVSNAIQDLEDALSGTLEVMAASVSGSKITFSSPSRTTKRTQYYSGMSIQFIAPIQIAENSVTTMSVDNLPEQQLYIPYLINDGESTTIYYDGTKFIGAMTVVPKSASIDLNSNDTVATSLAVKTLNDNKVEKTVQIIAGNGLTGGGDLTTNRRLNVVSADDGIIVNADNIRVNTTNDVDSTSTTRPASARAVKGAYDKGVEALNMASTAKSTADSKVSKSGDTMTGKLTVSTTGNAGIILNTPSGTANYLLGMINGSNHFYLGKSSTNSNDVSLHNYVDNVGIALTSGSIKTSAPVRTETNAASGLVLHRNNTNASNNNICFSYTNASYYLGAINGTLKYGTDVNLTNGYSIYHSGNKPSASDVGAIPNSGLGYSYGMANGQVSFGIGKGNEIGFGLVNGGELYMNYSVGSGYKIPSGLRLCNGTSAFGTLRCGEIISSGNMSAFSDIRVKKDLEIISNPIEKIMAINGYTYTRIDSGLRQAGVVAQEIEKVLPEVITKGETAEGGEILGVSYGNIVPLLIEGIKEQKRTIDSLEERLERLEKLLEVK